MGQNAQFDLAVVRVQQNAAGLCHKEAAQAAALFGAHRDVLQVRLGGGEAARAGLGLQKGGVDPPVRPDDLQKAVGVGGKQLLAAAVLQNVVNDGAVAAQAFQRGGVGGIAALGLFAVGQAQLVKQGLAQLLGAVQVEGIAHLLVNAAQAGVQLVPQFVAEGGNAVPVHQHAGALHVRQHPGEGQLDLPQKLVHAQLGELLVQQGQQARQQPGIRRVRAGEGRLNAVFGGQGAQFVLAGGGVQQVGGQLAVKFNGAAHAPGGQRQMVQGLCVKHPQVGVGAVQQVGEGAALQPEGGAALVHGGPAVPGGQGGQKDPSGERRIGRSQRPLLRRGGGCRALGQAQAGDQAVHFQAGQQGGGLFRLAGAAAVSAGGGVNGGVQPDLAQCVAQAGLVLIFRELFAHAGLDAGVVQMVVHLVQAAEGLHQRQRGFFAHAGHTGNVVGRVAHQALHLDELAGVLQAVLLPDGLRVHGHGLAPAGPGGRQQNGDVVIHQLQAVPVAGGQKAFIAPGGRSGGKGAQQVIGLPALPAHHHKAKLGQQLFQNRHLLGQFLRHPVAGGLVAVVHLVAEGGGLQVPGDGHFIGLILPQKVQQNVQKAIDGVGGAIVLGGEDLNAVKGPVDQAVAVQYKQFHGVVSSLRAAGPFLWA